MKKVKNIFLTRYVKILLVCVVLGLGGYRMMTSAVVPNEYIANYEIKDDRDKTLGLFVEIEAASKGDITAFSGFGPKFTELVTHFNALFGKFPQDYAFKVTYQQCINITNSLAQDPTNQSKLSSFLSDCYKPFNDILKKINSKYTIIPSAKVSPASGPSPLTVTFDARASTDPSNETIPSSNFFWYYRDTDGQDKVIGNSPVINYTFDEAGNYLVHLTVRSSNRLSEGIFDGGKNFSIDVTPKTAVISIYANGQKMRKDNPVKMGTLEAERGVVFDATTTIAMGGRQIVSNHRSITSKEGFIYTKDADGTPSVVRVSLPGQGQFKVDLTTVDNENNRVTETYYLIISDPIAIIKQNPEKGNTSSTFNFDSSASYSVLSKIRLYTWEIFDDAGEKLEVYQGQSIKQNFKKPGTYTVKLTVEDEQGQTNIDTVHVLVDSTDPIPQFIFTPTSDWLYPSKFVLDASMSSDVDVSNGYDQLSYDWFLPEEANTKIVQTENDNEKVIVEFNSVGKFKIKLTAIDKYGKMAEISKDIEVKSILRPEVNVSPIATYRGNPLNFDITSNEAILNYQWDFGDGDQRTIQVANIKHVYRKTSVYQIKLVVDGVNGNSNSVAKTVFIGEKDYPVAGYVVSKGLDQILIQNAVCSETDAAGQTFENAAYQADRYQEITIDPSLSVNSKGEKSDLVFYFQPGGKEIYKQSDFKYKFDEMGCQYVDLTAEDTAIGKNNKVRVRFKVVNALPKLDNLVLFFPQYGNEIGVGFNENTMKDTFSVQFDPLIVKVSATNPIDPDGNISYFKRYYYYKDDPNRILETKITPSDVPYAYFSLPRIAGEFMFGVTIYDNDDGQNRSEDVIGNGPEVFFPPDASKPDVPLVTLRTDQSTVEVGDEITFDVISKVISGRPDFVRERTIYYDFDGDGTRDLITKDDRVKYAYGKPSDDTLGGYTPRASVLYRGYRGTANGGKIVVKNGLKPKLLYDKFDKLVIFRDVSFGDIVQKSFCLDIKNCTNPITGGTAFSYEYPDYGKYFVSLDVTDPFANKASKKLAIILSAGDILTGDFHMLSIPSASYNASGIIDLFVGNNLDNSILYYIKYNNPRGECYLDMNIGVDSDVDGITDNDHDFPCNQLFMQKYTPNYSDTVGRLYYSDDSLKLVSQDFNVSFLDFEVKLDPEIKLVYDDLTVLLSTMEIEQRSSGVNATFKGLLVTLRDGLMDVNITKSNVVQVNDFMTNNQVDLTDEQLSKINSILEGLSDKSVVAAQGGSEYQKAKAEILNILPTNLALQVADLFNQFEIVVGDATLDVSQQDKRKEFLQKIVDTISANVAVEGVSTKEGQIDKIDMDNIVMPNICIIMNFYSIVSSFCSSEDIKAVPIGIAVEKGTTSTSRLRIILIVLGVLVGVFLVLVVIFAVRARMTQAKEEEIGAEPTTPPVAT